MERFVCILMVFEIRLYMTEFNDKYLHICKDDFLSSDARDDIWQRCLYRGPDLHAQAGVRQKGNRLRGVHKAPGSCFSEGSDPDLA